MDNQIVTIVIAVFLAAMVALSYMRCRRAANSKTLSENDQKAASDDASKTVGDIMRETREYFGLRSAKSGNSASRAFDLGAAELLSDFSSPRGKKS